MPLQSGMFIEIAGDTVWVPVNHFKSKGYGSPSSSNARREKQAKAVAEIYRNRVVNRRCPPSAWSGVACGRRGPSHTFRRSSTR